MGDLRLGRWQDALAGVECDAAIGDAPYGERTHKGDGAKRTNDGSERRVITYDHWTPADVAELVASFAGRTRRWMAFATSHDLIPAYEQAYADAGWYGFAPVPWCNPSASVRMSGDGPASGTCYWMVARPRTAQAKAWRSLPPFYVMPQDRGARIGGKPLSLMRAIIRDYSNEGDLVCDPCGGYGTTLIAAEQMKRRAIGSEIDADAYAEACARIDAAGRQGSLL